jgi:hypothetical protein
VGELLESRDKPLSMPPIKIHTGGWLGRQDSNLGMVESKSTALPLGDAPAGGRTIVISPEARYCGFTPPEWAPPAGLFTRPLQILRGRL